MADSIHIQLRPSTESDFEFVFQLNKTNMKKYVEKMRGWDEAFERAEMQTRFTPGVDKIIQVDGEDAGVWRVLEDAAYLTLDHVELLPKLHGKGIGTQLITELTHQAKSKNKHIILRVLRRNWRAKKLYETLGFKEIGAEGLKIIMKYE